MQTHLLPNYDMIVDDWGYMDRSLHSDFKLISGLNLGLVESGHLIDMLKWEKKSIEFHPVDHAVWQKIRNNQTIHVCYIHIYVYIHIYTYIYIYIHIIQRCTGESPVIPNPSCKSDHLRTTAVPLRGCRSARRSSSHCLSGFGGAFLLHFCKSHGSFHGIITYMYIYMPYIYICHIYIYISYIILINLFISIYRWNTVELLHLGRK